MTRSQRTRIYCCLMECGVCGSRRGEYCKSKHGRIMYTSYHTSRHLGSRIRFSKALIRLHAKLKAQIESEGEIPGHE